MIIKLKRKLSISLIIAMLLTLIPYGEVPIAKASKVSWNVGPNLRVSIGIDQLNVVGTGALPDYERESDTPWYQYSRTCKIALK